MNTHITLKFRMFTRRTEMETSRFQFTFGWRWIDCAKELFYSQKNVLFPIEMFLSRMFNQICCHDISISNAWINYNLGIFLTLAVAFIFWRHRQTPVIKASGRELSGILLLATLCSFAMTFLIASRPSVVKCAVTRFSLGLTHTVAFAAIAVKTNRWVNKWLYFVYIRQI